MSIDPIMQAAERQNDKPGALGGIAYLATGCVVSGLALKYIGFTRTDADFNVIVGIYFCFGVFFWPVIVVAAIGLGLMHLLGGMVQWLF